MKKIEFVRLGVTALALIVGSAGARAGDCHELIANRHYECASNDAETSGLSLQFSEDGRLVFLGDGEVLGCFCSSLGSVAQPGVEGGRGIACVDHIGAGEARLFSARIQGRRLTQGTFAATAFGASEVSPFLCDRVD
jgi:hypothetical protein